MAVIDDIHAGTILCGEPFEPLIDELGGMCGPRRRGTEVGGSDPKVQFRKSQSLPR
ncbi:MAG: hypothetical protein WBE81_20320 [Pseudolabrys sp.]